ncbi:MAG: TetR/AcrR family transcriptional regulator [Clostridiales bacterium]|nr:TetR/AcrR family transcriptional regulator [Clostridiales bacterium]
MTESYTGKRARSRQIIMHAAKGLFEEKGIRNVTFSDIAARAGMSRTTVFNYFSTVNDLLIALVDQEMDDLLRYCEESGLCGEPLIKALFLRLIEDTANYPLLTIRLIFNSILNRQADNSIARFEERIRDNLGSMSPEEKEQQVVIRTGLYYGLVNHYLTWRIPFDADEMKERFLVLYGKTAG